MDARATSAWRRWLLRAAGTAAFLGLLAYLLPLGEVAAAFARVPPLLFLGVWAGFVLGHLLAAAKWRALVGGGLTAGAALRAHVAGLAANLCLPGAAGGDVVRAGMAQMALRDGGKVVSGSATDRLIDLVALAILAAGGALSLGQGQAWGALAWQVLALTALALGAFVWAVPRLVPWAWTRFAFLPFRGLALRSAAELGTLARRPVLLAGALALSVLIQGWFVLLAMWLGRAAGVDLGPAVWFLAWPLAKLLAVLPVSLNGLGLREATLAGLMVPFGAAGAAVVAAGLVWQAVLFATGGLGALVLALSRGGAAKISKNELQSSE